MFLTQEMTLILYTSNKTVFSNCQKAEIAAFIKWLESTIHQSQWPSKVYLFVIVQLRLKLLESSYEMLHSFAALIEAVS